MREDELFVAAKELRAPLELVREVAAAGRLPVVNFVAGGIATPADAALAMQLGADGVFVGSGHLQERGPGPHGERDRPGDDPLRQPEDPGRGLARGWARPMRGIALEAIPEGERLAVRGW